MPVWSPAANTNSWNVEFVKHPDRKRRDLTLYSTKASLHKVQVDKEGDSPSGFSKVVKAFEEGRCGLMFSETIVLSLSPAVLRFDWTVTGR